MGLTCRKRLKHQLKTRDSWRQRVALCIGDAGRIKVNVNLPRWPTLYNPLKPNFRWPCRPPSHSEPNCNGRLQLRQPISSHAARTLYDDTVTLQPAHNFQDGVEFDSKAVDLAVFVADQALPARQLLRHRRAVLRRDALSPNQLLQLMLARSIPRLHLDHLLLQRLKVTHLLQTETPMTSSSSSSSSYKHFDVAWIMLIIAKTTGVQTVVMNGNSNIRVVWKRLGRNGKQNGLESLSENRKWRRRCDAERPVVPDGGTRNRIICCCFTRVEQSATTSHFGTISTDFLKKRLKPFLLGQQSQFLVPYTRDFVLGLAAFGLLEAIFVSGDLRLCGPSRSRNIMDNQSINQPVSYRAPKRSAESRPT